MTAKRELIDTGDNKLYMRREEHGRFKSGVDVGKSSAADQKHTAKTKSKPGRGDHGDR